MRRYWNPTVSTHSNLEGDVDQFLFQLFLRGLGLGLGRGGGCIAVLIMVHVLLPLQAALQLREERILVRYPTRCW